MEPDQQLQQINQLQNAPSPVVMALMSGVYLVVIVAAIAGMWRTFTKAGKPGWAAIVPIYNLVVLAEIAGKPVWWGLMLCIPCVNFIFLFLLMIPLAERFGKPAGFGIGLALLGFIFFPILGFGNAQYRGQNAA
jgi:glycopeptide antibiotics resistance protein